MKQFKNIIQYLAVALSIILGGLIFWRHPSTNKPQDVQKDKDKKDSEQKTVSEWLDLKNNPYAPLIIGCGGFLNLPQHTAPTTTVDQNRQAPVNSQQNNR